jgi:hypothetical protein
LKKLSMEDGMKKIWYRTWGFCFFLGLCGLAAAQQPEGGAYYVSALGSDAASGLSPDGAFKTLNRAVSAATEGPVKRIVLLGVLNERSEAPLDAAAGRHQESVFFINNTGDAEILITGPEPGAEAGPAAQLQGCKGRRVVSVSGNSRIRFERLGITQGDTGAFGGGLYIQNGAAVTLGNGAVVNGNQAQEGGGCYALRGALALESDARIEGNSVQTDEGGGAVIRDGVFTMSGAASVRNNAGGGIILRNTSAVLGGDAAIVDNQCEYDGGGLFVIESQMTVQGKVQISGNRAGRNGGGLLAYNAFILINGGVLIEDNQADRDGGGIEAGRSVIKILGNAGIARNQAGDDGGGIHLARDSRLILGEGSCLEGNRAACGGGLCVEDSSVLIQDQVMVQRNIATRTSEGGGGLCVGIGGFLTLKGGEVRHNEAIKGGGVYSQGGLRIVKGVIAGNTARTGGGVYLDNGSAKVCPGAAIRGNKAEGGGGLYMSGGSFRKPRIKTGADIAGNEPDDVFPPPVDVSPPEMEEPADFSPIDLSPRS